MRLKYSSAATLPDFVDPDSALSEPVVTRDKARAGFSSSRSNCPAICLLQNVVDSLNCGICRHGIIIVL